MGFFKPLLKFLVAFVVGFTVANSNSFKESIQSYIENGQFLTLEAKILPDQIIEAKKRELQPNQGYSFEEPTLKFYPYVLMDVKYTQINGKTKEGQILWGLVDGEMVISTDPWLKTHGFEDAINAKANRFDFLLINILSKHRGRLNARLLQKELGLDEKEFQAMVEGARKKYLVVLKGNDIALHFEDPLFHVQPNTEIPQDLVTMPYSRSQRVAAKYTPSQIERCANHAFGHDFTVRHSKKVYLPVYNIEVQNPDGSLLSEHFSAITGQRLN